MAQTLLERNTEILARIGALNAIAPAVEQIFRRGKEHQLERGTDAQGHGFTRLAPSTLKQRRQSSIPFLKRGAAASILTAYSVRVEMVSGRLIVTAGWPMPWVRYHVKGSKRLPRRDPGGFRESDRAEAMRRLKAWVMQGIL